jgi:hypothetical protein
MLATRNCIIDAGTIDTPSSPAHEIHDRGKVRRELTDDQLEAGLSTGVDNRVVDCRSDFPGEQQKTDRPLGPVVI